MTHFVSDSRLERPAIEDCSESGTTATQVASIAQNIGEAGSKSSGPDAAEPRPPAVTRLAPRLLICPPALLAPHDAPVNWRDRLLGLCSRLLRRPIGGTRSHRPQAQLHRIRDEFLLALDACDSAQAQLVRERIGRARSLRELWHLRAELFSVVARQWGEPMAQLRLDGLNLHFPMQLARGDRHPNHGGRTSRW